MSGVAVLDAMSHLLNIPKTLEKFIIKRGDQADENRGTGSMPVDILDSPKDYTFYVDVPSLSKSNIQVTVEDERSLVIKSGRKRKREDGEEGCRYVRWRRLKIMRKFQLMEDANVGAITAKCENGVLTVVVEKLPPPKPKKVEDCKCNLD